MSIHWKCGGGTQWNLKSFADREPVAMIGTPSLDGELTSQHEIMVRALAVIMPGNDIGIGQRKDTNLNVRADNDGLDAFHLVVGHLEATRTPWPILTVVVIMAED
jgi:hypothetical protein